MNIPKAITKLIDLKHGLDLPDMADYEKALNMSIWGLKRIQFLQGPKHKPKEPLLPGQTED